MGCGIDEANETAELLLNVFLANCKKQGVANLTRGKCNYCDEPTEEYFCDADCRDDWEHEKKVKARQRGENL